mgnify:CR=1 FL=1
MPAYSFEAIDAQGATQKGLIDADTAKAARGLLRARALVPLSVEPAVNVGADGKGKGLIGALNYLSDKGCNTFSFLTYNAGGDGDNVWPFIARDDKLHYDCSKLDQWGIVFDHAQAKGLYLHFKMQEQENDDQ